MRLILIFHLHPAEPSPSGNVRYGGAFLVAFATFPMAPLACALACCLRGPSFRPHTDGWAGANLSPDASRAAGIGIVGFAMNIGGCACRFSAQISVPHQTARTVSSPHGPTSPLTLLAIRPATRSASPVAPSSSSSLAQPTSVRTSFSLFDHRVLTIAT